MRKDLRRAVILVPTERDEHNERYQSVYWPNFVCGATEAIKRVDRDARVLVGPSQMVAVIEEFVAATRDVAFNDAPLPEEDRRYATALRDMEAVLATLAGWRKK